MNAGAIVYGRNERENLECTSRDELQTGSLLLHGSCELEWGQRFVVREDVNRAPALGCVPQPAEVCGN